MSPGSKNGAVVDPATDAMTRVRDEVLARATEHFRHEAGVVGVFLAGSLSTANFDCYSDIDLRVVLRDEHAADVLAKRAQVPRHWGPFLFHEAVAETVTVSYYATLTKIDVVYYREDSFRAHAWFGLPATVLYDPKGTIAAVIALSRVASFTSSVTTLEADLAKALASLIEAAKRWRRGELVYAARLAAGAADALMLAEDRLEHRAPFGVAKFRYRSDSPLARLVGSGFATGDAADVHRYLRALAGVLEHLLDAVPWLESNSPSDRPGLKAALSACLYLLD